MHASVFSALLLVACNSDGGAGDVASARTQELRTKLEAEVGIDDALPLVEVGQVYFAPDDGLLVSQPQNRGINRYSADGRLLNVIGSPGRGPGELNEVLYVSVSGDSVVVAASSRIHVFTLSGDIVRTVQWNPRPIVSGAGIVLMPSAPLEMVMAGETVLLKPGIAAHAAQAAPAGPTANAISIPVLRVDYEFRVDTVAVERQSSLWVPLRYGREQHIVSMVANDVRLAAVAPDGSRVAVVQVAEKVRRRQGVMILSIVSPSGDTIESVEVPFAPRTLDALAPDEIMAMVQTFPSRSQELPPPEAVVDALRSARGLSKLAPPVLALVVGQDNSIWLKREVVREGKVLWQVFDASLAYSGAVWLPINQTVAAARGGRFVTIQRGPFDEPSLLVFSVARPRAPAR
jgi:hypothetical protein